MSTGLLIFISLLSATPKSRSLSLSEPLVLRNVERSEPPLLADLAPLVSVIERLRVKGICRDMELELLLGDGELFPADLERQGLTGLLLREDGEVEIRGGLGLGAGRG
jgi:hypothetical protein